MFLPWWITTIIAIGFLFKFKAYEVIFWGVFADILYSSAVINFLNIQFLFTMTFILLFMIMYFIKKRLMFYST